MSSVPISRPEVALEASAGADARVRRLWNRVRELTSLDVRERLHADLLRLSRAGFVERRRRPPVLTDLGRFCRTAGMRPIFASAA
jgi:hypothetical protein